MKTSELLMLAAAAAVLAVIVKKVMGNKPFVMPAAAQEIHYGEPNGWRYWTDGTAISPDGVYYLNGSEVYNPAGMYTQ